MTNLDKEKVLDMLTDIEVYIDETMEDDFYKYNIKSKLSELVFWLEYSKKEED